MPEPLRGLDLVTIAEYGSAFEVDAAIAQLASNGITATSSEDPALRSIANFMASDRVYPLVVRAEDAEAASTLLNAVDGSLPPEFLLDEASPDARPRSRRSRKVITWVVLLTFTGIGPLLAILVLVPLLQWLF